MGWHTWRSTAPCARENPQIGGWQGCCGAWQHGNLEGAARGGVAVALALGLVPGVLALDLCLPTSASLPTGIPDALGCSGSGGASAAPERATWSWLAPSVPTLAENGAPVAVATDGFFLLSAQTHGLSAEETQAQLRVRVLDAAGAERAGDVQLRLESEGYYLFGWTARAPLAIGDRLSAVLSADPSASGAATVGGTFPLAVMETPAQLPEPELVLDGWARFYEGTGKALTCRSANNGGCGQESFSVPETLEERRSVALHWIPPAASGALAWQLRWHAEPASADAESRWTYWGHEQRPILLGAVVFPDRNERHCVSVVIEDLRNGQMRRTQACAEPGPLEGFRTDTALRQCAEPPSAALTRAWCNLKGGLAPQCAELPPEEGAPGNEVVASTDAGSAEATGCQLGGSGSAHAPGGALLASVALWLARRRQRRTQPVAR